MKKCTFYDELYDLFRCRPVNIQKGKDSLNTISLIDVNMFDNMPDTDGAIPGCSTFSDDFNSCIIKNKSQPKSIDKDNTGNNNENDSIDYFEENSGLIDKGVEQQLETPRNSEIINNDNNVAILMENDKNKDSKKRIKFTKSTKRQTFAQVFDNYVEKLIKSNEDITRIAIETQSKMMNDILKQQEKMLQQTELLIQNLHANTTNSQVATHYFSTPEQFRPPLQSFNNPRFVRVPLNVVQSSERCLPVIMIPPSSPTPSSIVPFSSSSSISTTSLITYNSSSTSTLSQVPK